MSVLLWWRFSNVASWVKGSFTSLWWSWIYFDIIRSRNHLLTLKLVLFLISKYHVSWIYVSLQCDDSDALSFSYCKFTVLLHLLISQGERRFKVNWVWLPVSGMCMTHVFPGVYCEILHQSHDVWLWQLMDTNAQLWYIIREYIANTEVRLTFPVMLIVLPDFSSFFTWTFISNNLSWSFHGCISILF